MTVLCLGQARAITEAVQAWPPQAEASPTLDATVSLVEDGRVLFAAGEERFSRRKQHAGFPYQALDAALSFTRTRADQCDHFLPM